MIVISSSGAVFQLLLTVVLYETIFALSTGVHLYASLRDNSTLRAVSKPLILLSLLGLYLEATRLRGAIPSTLVVMAVVLSCAGDVLLIPNGEKWLAAGGVCFGLSHLLYIFAYLQTGLDLTAVPAPSFWVLAVLYAVVILFTFMLLSTSLPKLLRIPILIYLCINGAMNLFAWLRLIGGSCSTANGLMVGCGAVLFFLSDTVVFYGMFKKRTRLTGHFTVMVTYAAAQLLIVLGLILAA